MKFLTVKNSPTEVFKVFSFNLQLIINSVLGKHTTNGIFSLGLTHFNYYYYYNIKDILSSINFIIS